MTTFVVDEHCLSWPFALKYKEIALYLCIHWSCIEAMYLPPKSNQCCRYRMPEDETPKDAAYQIIHDELLLDGNPRLNLASFVTTWMEVRSQLFDKAA